MTLSIVHALDILGRLKAVEHTWEGRAMVVKATKPDAKRTTLLDAVGIHLENPMLSVTPAAAA